MQLYTSHWSSALLPHVAATMIAISRGKPRWKLAYRYRVLSELAPDDATWTEETEEGFERSYLDQLQALGSEAILARLAGIGDGRPICLLCWEKPHEKYCHRWTLADFLQSEAGITVPELEPGMLPDRPGVPEPRLF